MSRKMEILKELYALVKALNRKKITGSRGFGVCKIFITTLTEYFFPTFGLGTTSVGEKPFFTQQKEKKSIDTFVWSHVH